MTQQNYPNISFAPENENLMNVKSSNMAKSLVEETKKHRAMFPEIHYKLRPFITVTCDALEASGMMPNQDELDNITDNIYEEFIKMHPDMENYMNAGGSTDPMQEAVPTFDGFGRGFGFGRSRRRGIGRDLISALLLAELFGRRRFGRFPFFPVF